MKTNETKYSLLDGFQNFARHHTVGIYRSKVDKAKKVLVGTPEFIGSGVLIEYGRNFYLATAGHILVETMDDKYEYGICTRSQLFIRPDHAKFVNPDSGQRYDNLIDIGVWRINKEVADEIKKFKEFLPPSFIELNHQEKDDMSYLCLGFPKKKVKIHLGENQIIEGSFGYITRGVSKDTCVKVTNYDQNYNFLFAFHRDKLRNVKTGSRHIAPKPYGMSGGGVWHFDTEGDISLVGILTEWKLTTENIPVIMATRIECIVDVICEFEGQYNF